MTRFFTEDISFELPDKQAIKVWLQGIAKQENRKLGDLNYIFCSDEYLLDVNRQYLNHDYYTDIITFDNSESPSRIDGDIFISIDRVQDNAQTIGVAFETELKRVLAHGLLHLIGYGDKTEDDQKQMRAKEDYYI